MTSESLLLSLLDEGKKIIASVASDISVAIIEGICGEKQTETPSQQGKRIYEYDTTPGRVRQSLAAFVASAIADVQRRRKEVLKNPSCATAKLGLSIASAVYASASDAFSDIVVADRMGASNVDLMGRPALPKSKRLTALRASSLSDDIATAVVDIAADDGAQRQRGRATLETIVLDGSSQDCQHAAAILGQADDPLNRFKIVRLAEAVREHRYNLSAASKAAPFVQGGPRELQVATPATSAVRPRRMTPAETGLEIGGYYDD